MNLGEIHEGIYNQQIANDIILEPPPPMPMRRLERERIPRAPSYQMFYYFDDDNRLQLVPNYQLYLEEPPPGSIPVIENLNIHPFKKIVWYRKNNRENVDHIGNQKNSYTSGQELFNFEIYLLGNNIGEHPILGLDPAHYLHKKYLKYKNKYLKLRYKN